MSGPILTFERWHETTADLTGAERRRLFEFVLDEECSDCWQRVREQLEGDRVAEGVLDLRRRRRPQLSGRAPRIAGAGVPSPATVAGGDVFLTIPPPDYVEALTGEAVPAHGAICCPLPGHEDRTPSCHVYRDPGRGWYCFGCHRGGTIYDLAREVSGIGDRGRDFKQLQTWIAQRILNTGVAA